MHLTINNSFSDIKGLYPADMKALRTLLSYVEPNSHFTGRPPSRKYLIDRYGNFPTGLLPRVLEYAKAHIDLKLLKIQDKRVQPKVAILPQIKLNGFEPYKHQLEAVEVALKKHRGIISATTGSGKSLIIALIAARLNVRTLVVVPTLEIKAQLIEAFSAILNDASKIDIRNIDSIDVDKAVDYGCLIIDEAHHSAAKTYRKLNQHAWKGIYYRYYLTATPFRNQTEETLLFESIAGQIIYTIDYKTAVANHYVLPIEAYYYELPKVKTDAYTWGEVYSELVVNNGARNALIANLITNLYASNKSTLCLVKEIKHGQILSELTGIPFVNGADEDSRHWIKKFNSRQLKCLIGTTGVLGEGVDTKPCEYVIVAGLGKAKSAFMQQVGRCLRTYPGKESGKVILLQDKSHKFCSSHFKEQRAILLEEYEVTCVKL